MWQCVLALLQGQRWMGLAERCCSIPTLGWKEVDEESCLEVCRIHSTSTFPYHGLAPLFTVRSRPTKNSWRGGGWVVKQEIMLWGRRCWENNLHCPLDCPLQPAQLPGTQEWVFGEGST